MQYLPMKAITTIYDTIPLTARVANTTNDAPLCRAAHDLDIDLGIRAISARNRPGHSVPLGGGQPSHLVSSDGESLVPTERL